MKRQHIGAIFAAATATALTAWACASDPTADLRGGASQISLKPTVMYINEGESRGFEAVIRDDQLNPVPGSITATSSNTGVFTVAPDPGLPTGDGARYNFVVDAVAPGQGTLNVAGSGVSSSSTINVLPLSVPVIASTTSPQVGQVLTLVATGNAKFSATSTIDFGVDTISNTPIQGTILKRVPDTLSMILPQPDATAAGPLSVTNVEFGVPGLNPAIPTSVSFDALASNNNNSPDPAITLTIPATSADTIVLYDGFTSDGVDHFYSVTLAGTTTFKARLEWATASDLDILWCDAGCNNFVGNFDGATGANPEESEVTLAAGTYNFWINAFDNHDEPVHLYKIILTRP